MQASQFNLDNVTVYNKDPASTTLRSEVSKDGSCEDRMDVDALDLNADQSDLMSEQKSECVGDFLPPACSCAANIHTVKFD